MNVNVSGVFALFEHAIAHSLKYPKIRLRTADGQNVVLSRAGDKSRYTGQIRITDGCPYGANTYFGRIDKDGVFHVSTANASVLELLKQLSNDPANVAGEYGRLTGQCCFCGLALKDERSTAVGYGPICADKYGVAWGFGKPQRKAQTNAEPMPAKREADTWTAQPSDASPSILDILQEANEVQA